jgi:methyltransferase
MIAAVVLIYVTLARLAELAIARRNTARQLAAGAREFAPRHYPLIVAVHVAWLATLWVMAWDQPVHRGWLAVFAALQPLRVWVLATLGARWTTRIILVPGDVLVRAGPYRWFRHPNYAVVVGEIVSLPLAFGLWQVALVFSVLNAAVLTIRIRAENRALALAR